MAAAARNVSRLTALGCDAPSLLDDEDGGGGSEGHVRLPRDALDSPIPWWLWRLFLMVDEGGTKVIGL